jgi:hypothetical protein
MNNGSHTLPFLAANDAKTVNWFSEEQANPSFIAPQVY